jgi:hypothetical protein
MDPLQLDPSQVAAVAQDAHAAVQAARPESSAQAAPPGSAAIPPIPGFTIPESVLPALQQLGQEVWAAIVPIVLESLRRRLAGG